FGREVHSVDALSPTKVGYARPDDRSPVDEFVLVLTALLPAGGYPAPLARLRVGTDQFVYSAFLMQPRSDGPQPVMRPDRLEGQDQLLVLRAGLLPVTLNVLGAGDAPAQRAGPQVQGVQATGLMLTLKTFGEENHPARHGGRCVDRTVAVT